MGDNCFVSVDWGTSNFRVRLVEVPSLRVLEEVRSSQGVKEAFALWQKQESGREGFFLNFVKNQMGKFNNPITGSVQVVISGMASSSIGIKELPYAILPFDSNGSTLQTENINHPDFPYQVKLISGVRSESDVIRGEEVQVVGLISDEDRNGTSVFILPGTHSKHVICKDGIVTGFKTYMTGELFQVIVEHTILNNSLVEGELDKNGLAAYNEGLNCSQNGGSMLNELFKIRAFDLFGTKSKTENYFFLSGLLIGDEVMSLKRFNPDKINLCAGGNLYELYHRALHQLGLMEKTNLIPKETVDVSVVKGQWMVLKGKM